MDRSKFKTLATKTPLPITVVPNPKGPQWSCGDDLPVTWEPSELRTMAFKNIKANLRAGAISKELYHAMMKDVLKDYPDEQIKVVKSGYHSVFSRSTPGRMHR